MASAFLAAMGPATSSPSLSSWSSCFDYDFQSFVAPSPVLLSGGLLHRTYPALNMFRPTATLGLFAHWYAGRSKKHRYQREKRYHPRYDIQRNGRNRFSRKLSWKTNRWNYIQAHRDMP
jgi:hypothetical protein